MTFRLGETVSRHRGPPTGPPQRGGSSPRIGQADRRRRGALLRRPHRRDRRSNLAAAGLAADDRGRLKVNAHFRTAVPHIYAAGDVIGFPSLASTSMERAAWPPATPSASTRAPMAALFPFGIYSIPEISMVGTTEDELTAARVPYETGMAHYREIARGQILGDDSGLLKILFHREDRQLLGVHAIGTGATELIHIGQAVMGLGGGLDYFLDTVFNYPTLAECYKVAALDACNKLRHV